MNVQLCKSWEGEDLTFPMTVEPKLDGVRAYVLQGKVFSRMHKELRNVEHIAQMLKGMGPYVFDGELLSKDWNETISVVHTHGNMGTSTVLHAFDVVPEEQWNKGVSLHRQIERTYQLGKLLATGDLNIARPTEVKVAHSLEQVMESYDHFLKLGYEGVVIKDPSAPYHFRRHKAWRKIKPFKTEEFTVVGIQEGTGKYVGMLGALIIQMTSGYRCGLGTGFSDDQRKSLWAVPPIGKIVEVQYQEMTKDGVLRFPSFKRVREDLRS